MANPVGWGLIGASTIAHQHMIAAIRAQPGHHIAAVLSGNAVRAAAFAAEHGIPAHTDRIEVLLANPAVQAVYVSSTNELHLPQVLAAAAAGRHVLCEKPLALNLEDARRMIAACERAGVVMATNHHLRNAATHRRIRALVAEGAIGQPRYARVFHAVLLPANLQGWRVHRPDAGGGVILDITVHDADTLRFALGAEPVRAVALTQRTALTSGGLEDGVMAVLAFDNGVLAQLHDAFTIPHAGTGFEIHGDAGSIIATDVMTQRAVGTVRLRDARGEREIPVEHENLYVRGTRAFAQAIAGTGAPAATAHDGLRSLAAALAVLEASRTGRTVEIPAA